MMELGTSFNHRRASAVAAVFVALVVFAVAVPSPSSAQESDPSGEDDCWGTFEYSCDGDPDDTWPAPTPTPDLAAWRDRARRDATDAIESQLFAPGWRIWPHHTRDQIVGLHTFFYVEDNWATYSTSSTFGSESVSVVATPQRSIWTLVETGTGSVTEITCQDRGEQWTHGATMSSCGWRPQHSSDVTGRVELTVQVEFEVVASTGDRHRFVTDPSQARTVCVGEILSRGSSPAANRTDEPCAGVQGSEGSESGVPGGHAPSAQSDIPTYELHCSQGGSAAAAILGEGIEVTGARDFTMTVNPDGSTTYRLEGDRGFMAALADAPWGAALGVNELVFGTYAEAGLAAGGEVGGGIEITLEPGASLWNLPNGVRDVGVFVDTTSVGQVGAEAGSGAIIGAVASAGASAERNREFRINSDGTRSETVTYSGEASAEAGASLGFASAAASAGIEISVETIYSWDGTPLESIVTVQRATHAEAVYEFEGGEDVSVTTDEWRFDLTDPAVAEAMGNLGDWADPDIGDVWTGPPPSLHDLLTMGTHTGPIDQKKSEWWGVRLFAAGGIFWSGVDFDYELGCTELQ